MLKYLMVVEDHATLLVMGWLAAIFLDSAALIIRSATDVSDDCVVGQEPSSPVQRPGSAREAKWIDRSDHVTHATVETILFWIDNAQQRMFTPGAETH
jgi:hypothetical protein